MSGEDNSELSAELDEDDALKLRRFTTWLSDRKFRPNPHLRLVNFSATGRGMMTTKSFRSGEILVAIPEALLVTAESIINVETLGRHLMTFQKRSRLKPIDVLHAFLMSERLKLDDSSFHPYLSMLPAVHTTPHFLPKGHLCHFDADIQASILSRDYIRFHEKRRITHDKAKLKAEFESVRPFLEYLSRAEFGPKILDFRLFLWARFTVTTRAIYCRKYQDRPSSVYKRLRFDRFHSEWHALAPFLDLFNHSCHAKVEAGFDDATRAFFIRTLEDIAPGSQVFINYGPHDNVTLLMDYGFAVPRNLHSIVQFTSDEIQESCRRVLYSDDNVVDLALPPGDYGCTWDGPTWGLTSAVKRILRDLRNMSLSRVSITLEKILRDLIGRRLAKLERNHQSDRGSRCLRSGRCLASTMSFNLRREQMDILEKHLPPLS